jgi:hypothetical protein
MSNTERAVNIESRTLPAIRDGSLDGWFVYISYMAAARNAISSQLGSSFQGRRYDTGRHGQSIMLYWVTLLQSARRAAVLGQISSVPPHWSNKPSFTESNISTVQNRMYMYSTSILPSTRKFLALGQIQRRRKGTFYFI